VFRAFATKRL